MPAPSTLFHQRRLFHGAGECLAIGPETVPWAEAGSLGGCQVRPRRDCQIPGDCIHGESPRGGGARRWRGWNIHLPLSHASPVERFSLEHPHLPARSAPPPAPFRGGGQCLAIGLVAVPGDRDRISAGCSHQAVEMLFPGSASMGYHPAWVGLAGGGGGTSPLSPVLAVERFSLEHPHLPARSAPPPAPYEGAGS